MKYEQDLQLKEFNCICKETDDLYHALALRLGLSDSALDVLYTLCIMGDGCLQRDVCRLCFTRKQTINSAIRKLERKGILTLTPGKGRDMHIFLTEKGRQLTREKVCPVLERESRAFAQLTLQERGLLVELSRKYLRLLQQELSDDRAVGANL